MNRDLLEILIEEIGVAVVGEDEWAGLNRCGRDDAHLSDATILLIFN